MGLVCGRRAILRRYRGALRNPHKRVFAHAGARAFPTVAPLAQQL